MNEIVEALRGKVEVERVVGRLMEERREFWCAGKGQGVSDGEEGDEGEDGKADVSMDA